MGQGILVTTAHSKINLPEHTAKAAAFRHSKLPDKALSENGGAYRGKYFTEAGEQDCQNLQPSQVGPIMTQTNCAAWH